VNDGADHEARDNLMYAATLAGIAFGNSGVHVPHGMAYSVAGLVRDFHDLNFCKGPKALHIFIAKRAEF